MARLGILTCSNCTQETHCASVVCLGDLRKRRGLFARYAADEPLDLIGIINCAGCPTLAAPEKILPRVRAVAAFKLDALHFSYCMTALCPFLKIYERVIHDEYPDLTIIFGTHQPVDRKEFQRGLKELLCPTIARPQSMNDLVKGTLSVPGGPLRF
jgi:predicted metal-binding protein